MVVLAVNEFACFTACSSALRIVFFLNSPCCFDFHSSRDFLRKRVACSGLFLGDREAGLKRSERVLVWKPIRKMLHEYRKEVTPPGSED